MQLMKATSQDHTVLTCSEVLRIPSYIHAGLNLTGGFRARQGLQGEERGHHEQEHANKLAENRMMILLGSGLTNVFSAMARILRTADLPISLSITLIGPSTPKLH
jgi:hypothetical protein